MPRAKALSLAKRSPAIPRLRQIALKATPYSSQNNSLIERTQRLQAIPDVAFSETSTINTASGTTTTKTSKDKSHT